MKRIIIDYDDAHFTPVEALRRVFAVATRGYESKGRRGIDHFCWVSTFSDDSVVSIREKKHAGAADSFVVCQEIKAGA
jgi:hypothetical protein